MAVVDRAPMPNNPKARALFQIFAERAAAEVRRLQAEAAVREREEKLSRVVNGAMDAIIELDAELRGDAAQSRRGEGARLRVAPRVGLDFRDFLTPESGDALAELAAELQWRGAGFARGSPAASKSRAWVARNSPRRRRSRASTPGGGSSSRSSCAM